MSRRSSTTPRRRERRVAATALTAAAALAVTGVSAAAADDDAGGGPGDGARPRNVILFIGDGLGAAQRNAGTLVAVGADGQLVMDELPYTGTVETDSADPEELVTDSAAAGTSYASGVKTYNGAIGLDADGQVAETILERAEAAGLATGLVTTGEVTDATTAAFGAHVADRAEQTEIARQFIEEADVDVLLGGGEDFWFEPGNEGAFPDGESQSDQGDLVARAQELGYEYVSDADALAAAGGDRLLGLFANRTMFVSEPEPVGNNDRVVSLAAMTEKAIEVLSADDDGFFLVVEEESIDEQAHDNNAAATIEGVALMDEAVAVGAAFAEAQGDTLVITTGDHETGGMAIEGPDNPEFPDETGEETVAGEPNISLEDGPFPVAGSDLEFVVDWTTGGHTNVEVPLTATGPGAERFVGHYENTAVHDVMLELLLGGGG